MDKDELIKIKESLLNDFNSAVREQERAKENLEFSRGYFSEEKDKKDFFKRREDKAIIVTALMAVIREERASYPRQIDKKRIKI